MADPAEQDRDSREAERASERSEVRAAVVRFLLVGLVTVGVIGVPAALLMQHLVRAHTLDALRVSTEMAAATMIAPLVDERFLAGDPTALLHMQRVVHGRVADGSVVRITIWDRDRNVLFSDATELIGEAFPEHDWPERLLVGGETTASFEDHGDPESLYEHPDGHFVEVDTPFVSASGDALIFEAYYPADIVHAQQRDLLLKLLPVGLGILLLLQLAQLPTATRLAGRIQSLQEGRRRLLRQAAAASDLERRRIARDLHDDVIQTLAGASYALESLEERVDGRARPVITQAGAVLQGSVRELRGMLTEIYPADLDILGLPQAVDRLADPLRAQGVQVSVSVPDGLAVGPVRATLLYRVAREALTNTLKHAEATSVTVRLRQDGRDVTLVITDDGLGFDPERADAESLGDREVGAENPPGSSDHLGLRLIRDTVGELGGNVDVSSTPGAGTRVTATIPLT